MKRLATAFPVRAVKRYLDAQGPNWATLIAWNALFALFPMVLITFTVIGVVLHDPTMAANFKRSFVDSVTSDPQQRAQIATALDAFRQHAGVFAVVGFLGLMWSGSSLFGAMEQGLSALYGCKQRDFVRQKLVGFGMILVFTVLTVPLVLSGTLLPALRSLSFLPSFLTTGPAALLIQIGAGILDGTLIFTAIYFVIPNRRQRLGGVLPGALSAGVLMEAFTLLFPVYVKLAGGFSTWGATFALFFLLMTLMFFLGQITVIGGAVNAERELGSRHEPEAAPVATLPGKAQRERVAQDRAR
ncbi:MAG TPA: YihY/virulence factor BrkB family protein [Candidatus Dormibacteraeota bacterium]|nr:YihY/virulence factor BrkB family protein [Candidatus Dormibacteraeota bacterium]